MNTVECLGIIFKVHIESSQPFSTLLKIFLSVKMWTIQTLALMKPACSSPSSRSTDSDRRLVMTFAKVLLGVDYIVIRMLLSLLSWWWHPDSNHLGFSFCFIWCLQAEVHLTQYKTSKPQSDYVMCAVYKYLKFIKHIKYKIKVVVKCLRGSWSLPCVKRCNFEISEWRVRHHIVRSLPK